VSLAAKAGEPALDQTRIADPEGPAADQTVIRAAG
jgi:hypothetical protein